MDASNMLKPALARGELHVVGATTVDEYRKNIEKDAALERRFKPVLVGESTVDDTVDILRGLKDRYEAHHRAKITEEAIVGRRALRPLPIRPLPTRQGHRPRGPGGREGEVALEDQVGRHEGTGGRGKASQAREGPGNLG
jgi:hypothetical protein